MAQDEALQALQRAVWQARLPLAIRLAAAECRIFDGADPYLVSAYWPDGCKHSILTSLVADFFSAALVSSFSAPAAALIFLTLTHC